MSNFYEYSFGGSVDDGEIISQEMSSQFERGYIAVDFFTDSASENLVIPTAGTITFTASENGNNYGTVDNGTVTADNDEYNRPNFSGSVERIKATTLGILGANFYVATVYRYEG